MQFISKPNPYAHVHLDELNIALDTHNDVQQLTKISIVREMLQSFKFVTDDDDDLIYVLINFDSNPYYLEWASPEIQDIFNLIALFKGVKLDEDDWEEIYMFFCESIHGDPTIKKVDFGGEEKVYLNEIHTTAATAEIFNHDNVAFPHDLT